MLLSELVLYFVHKYLILSSCHFNKNCDRIGESKKYHTGSDFMNTEVIYVSGTGNTAAVAKEIFQALPSSPKDIQELDRARNPLSADCYFIGFWANRGTASVEVLDFLSELHGKRWPFSAPAAWEIPRNTTRSWKTRSAPFLPDDNEYFGSFFCQGKCHPGA